MLLETSMCVFVRGPILSCDPTTAMGCRTRCDAFIALLRFRVRQAGRTDGSAGCSTATASRGGKDGWPTYASEVYLVGMTEHAHTVWRGKRTGCWQHCMVAAMHAPCKMPCKNELPWASWAHSKLQEGVFRTGHWSVGMNQGVRAMLGWAER